MLTKRDNGRLTRVGPETSMGQLLRRYWHPIAAVAEVSTGKATREVRVLGEDLVLYRDKGGTLGLVERSCPHRRASLAFGLRLLADIYHLRRPTYIEVRELGHTRLDRIHSEISSWAVVDSRSCAPGEAGINQRVKAPSVKTGQDRER